MSRRNFLIKLDSVLGRALSWLPRPREAAPGRCQDVLVIRPGGIGDAALLAPLLRSLATSYPGVKVDILAEQRNATVFDLVPVVRKIYSYDRPGDLMAVMYHRYDVVIDTEQWYRLSAVVARLLRAPVKIGFGTNERRRSFTHVVEYSSVEYEASSFARLLVPLGIEGVDLVDGGALTVPAVEQKRATELLEPLHGRDFVALFPGGSLPEKRWPVERFRQVADACLALGYAVVLIGDSSDRDEMGRRFEESKFLNLAGETSLIGTAALLERSALLISGDSGVLHFAAGLGTPTVSLFGPSPALKWAPRGSRHLVVVKDVNCSPCAAYGWIDPCLQDVRCMNEIEVDDVVRAAKVLLSGESPEC